MVDSSGVFDPEARDQAILDAVNAGYIHADGTRADLPQAAPVGGGVGFTFTMVLLPFITVFLAAVAWIGGFAGFAPRFRSVLTGLMPQAWVATAESAENNPLVVAIVLGSAVLLVLIGLTLTRRSVVRRWLRTRGFGAFLVGLGVFGISALRVLVLILTPGLLLVGTSIATGADLGSAPLPDDATVRAWPLVLTGLAMAWFALGSTRRAMRKRAFQLAAAAHHEG